MQIAKRARRTFGPVAVCPSAFREAPALTRQRRDARLTGPSYIGAEPQAATAAFRTISRWAVRPRSAGAQPERIAIDRGEAKTDQRDVAEVPWLQMFAEPAPAQNERADRDEKAHAVGDQRGRGQPRPLRRAAGRSGGRPA